MKLTGKQKERLHEGLKNAFSRAELERLLSFKLGIKLGDITSDTDLSDVVFQLINTAERQGWIKRLIREARKERPKNGNLRVLVWERVVWELFNWIKRIVWVVIALISLPTILLIIAVVTHDPNQLVVSEEGVIHEVSKVGIYSFEYITGAYSPYFDYDSCLADKHSSEGCWVTTLKVKISPCNNVDPDDNFEPKILLFGTGRHETEDEAIRAMRVDPIPTPEKLNKRLQEGECIEILHDDPNTSDNRGAVTIKIIEPE